MACTGSSVNLPRIECNAWKDLYSNLDGKNWKWYDGKLATQLDPCACPPDPSFGMGVTCTNIHITGLNFQPSYDLPSGGKMELTGTIPDSIGKLTKLKSLLVYGSPNLKGSIPTLTNLSMLEHISFINNKNLTWTIPSILSNLTHLEFNGNTKLTGTLPKLEYFTKPLALIIKDNALTGSIPNSYTNLTQISACTISNGNSTQNICYTPDVETWLNKNCPYSDLKECPKCCQLQS